MRPKFKTASLHIRRVKNGTPSTHPLTGRELRELRRHQRESPKSSFVFVSIMGGAVIGAGIQPHDRAGSRGSQARHQGACPHAAPRRWRRIGSRNSGGINASLAAPECRAINVNQKGGDAMRWKAKSRIDRDIG
jgi:hypothetical protein